MIRLEIGPEVLENPGELLDRLGKIECKQYDPITLVLTGDCDSTCDHGALELVLHSKDALVLMVLATCLVYHYEAVEVANQFVKEADEAEAAARRKMKQTPQSEEQAECLSNHEWVPGITLH